MLVHGATERCMDEEKKSALMVPFDMTANGLVASLSVPPRMQDGDASNSSKLALKLTNLLPCYLFC